MPLRQLYPADVAEGDGRPRVDIVAVHGLNPHSKPDEQHAWDTWRKPAGPAGRLWLRDDLPKVAPRSRIFLYEYNSTLVYGGDRGRFIDKANDLLEALRAERKKDDRRPLILVGHSLGGILIEQALVNAHNNLKYSAIRNSTTSLVFFATPHAGGNDKLVALGSAAARIARHIHVQPPNDIIETLKKGSLFTDVLTEHWRQQLESYQIVSFWEGIGDIVPKKSATFGLPGHRENVVRLDANHSDVCRFDGVTQRDKDNLKIVSSNLEDVYDHALKSSYDQRESPTPAHFTLDQKACLQSLYFPEMYWRKNNVADPAPTTCAWILKHEKYREWLDQRHRLLWIKGKPGAGKSTVLKYALETAERETRRDFTLASFFFHGRGKPIQKNVLGLFRSLLHQILQQNHELLLKFTSLYKGKCDTEGTCGTHWNWDEKQLQDFFKTCVVDTARTHQIRIYVDALDECGQDVAIDLVEFFRCSTSPIPICFSCRHYPLVALEGGNEICIENENGRDVEAYIRDKIEAHIQQTGIAKAIRNEILSRSQGSFQWVVLVMPRVLKLHKSGKSLTAIQIMIRNTPAELYELYTELLEGIEEHEKVQSLRCMQWISFAYRPLTLTQLRFALLVNADTSHTSIHQCRSSELYVETDEDMERRVYDLSKGLAEVLKNDNKPVVQFIHQSVKDFILEKGFEILESSSAGTVVGRAHLWLSRSCIKYFFMEEVQNFANLVWETNKSRSGARPEVEEEDYFDILRYSVEFWFLHAKEVENADMPQDDLATLASEPIDDFLDPWFTISHILEYYWKFHCDYYDLDDTTLLHIASRRNLISFVDAILTQGVWADPRDSEYRTPLSIAAKEGHEVIAKMLVNRDDVDANSRDVLENTPLCFAAKEGHEAVVEMLMNQDDVELNSKDEEGFSPLCNAAGCGHKAVVELLLSRKDIDADSKTCSGMTPLSLAAGAGYEAVVNILVNRHDVNVDSKDSKGDTALCQAAKMGRRAVLEILFERGVDLSPENNQLTVALLWGSKEGQYEVLKLLLQHNADANARDKENRTPLSWAVSSGSFGVVKLLLQRGSNADQKDKDGRTPLSYAAAGFLNGTHAEDNGHRGVLKLLKDKGGRIPQSYAHAAYWSDTHAVHKGRLVIVKLLLERSDVDANSKDTVGRTPLSYAASYGNYSVVELLVQRSDVDVDSKDTDGRTPLFHACHMGHVRIVELLLERNDVDVNSKDNYGRSPLYWALKRLDDPYPENIQSGMTVMELFLKRHDIDTTGEDEDLLTKYHDWKKSHRDT